MVFSRLMGMTQEGVSLAFACHHDPSDYLSCSRTNVMSLASRAVSPIPEETRRVAHAAFPRPSRFMQMRDQLGTLYDDAAFGVLYPQRGQPAETPWRLAVVTVMQFADGLTDRQ